jgi:NADP-dependent 3-hydroxy acid dehydrogenase YdfG
MTTKRRSGETSSSRRRADSDWTGRSAVVTGAGQGIGRAVALALAERGATVWLVGRNLTALDEVAAAARAAAGGSRPLVADLTSEDDVEHLRAELEDAGAQVDVLVHCAGSIFHGRLDSADVEDFDAQYRSNVRAPYRLTQALLPALVAREGAVVFMNSSIAGRARAGAGQFAATQSALKAVADALREEVNPSGVRVLSVFPGRTATPRQEGIHALEGKEYRPEELMQPEDVATIVISALELPRTAEVTEISMRPLKKPPA